MNARKPLPIGPLALALRHRSPGSPRRTLAILAMVFTAALLIGVALLLRHP